MQQSTSYKSIQFRLALPAEQCKRYYRGEINQISTISTCNQSLQLPFNTVKQFLTQNGLYGLFEMHFDQNNKFISVQLIR